ncbi:unnamed protein product [Mytilus coruscus]|uniref:Uncharacterized protein n=1 Tax=Mytilus coruscus TaxID=42192 RepID=A0A6J8BWA2_MYTCO|nr:unnamed protein product [Mytilus coruscus]
MTVAMITLVNKDLIPADNEDSETVTLRGLGEQLVTGKIIKNTSLDIDRVNIQCKAPLTDDVILGLDILDTLGAVINLSTPTLTINNKVIHAAFVNSGDFNRNNYNKMKRKAQFKYKRRKGMELCDLASTAPRKFWSSIKRKGNYKYKIDNKTMMKHFESIPGDSSQDLCEEVRNLIDNTVFDDINVTQLDSEIIVDEVIASIKKMKSGKSSEKDKVDTRFRPHCAKQATNSSGPTVSKQATTSSGHTVRATAITANSDSFP